MIRIDKAILDTNGVICDNISQLSSSDRGLLSQNILGHIRNFVEYIAVKAYSNGQDVNPNDYNLNVAALKDMQCRGNCGSCIGFTKCFRNLCRIILLTKMDRSGSCSNTMSIY